MRTSLFLAFAVLVSLPLLSIATTATAAPTTAAAATTAAGTATCSAVNTRAAVIGASTLFNITGMNWGTCTQVRLTSFAAPTTMATTAATTLATTSMATTTAATTTSGTTVTTTAVATTTTTAGTTVTTATTAAPVTSTPAPATPAPTGLIQDFLPTTETTSRTFVFSPLVQGRYTVDVLCGAQQVNVSLCGSFWASNPSGPISFIFNVAAPANIDQFKMQLQMALARAANIDVSQVLIGAVVPTTRRAAGFTVATNYIGTETQTDYNAVQAAVATAATNGNVNTQLAAVGAPQVAQFSVNGATATPAGAAIATTAPIITPTPSGSISTSAFLSASVIMSMLFTALLALF